MRNLKKLLALVLAMAMAFSLMLSASAVEYKDYPDKDSITEEFQESVQVLTGLKVFQGDEGGFRPGDTITRAEVATIIYRLATGDVDGKQINIYADYGNFVDVSPSDWFAGAVGYCANAEYIKGHDGYFNPYDSVTGYEALAMILRAVGYDQNHEFEGAGWQTRVASLSKELKVTENVKNANFETTLSMAARRDVVADLLFQTAVLVPTVTYTPALSYSDKISIGENRKNPTLGQKTFGLFVDDEWSVVDNWGTPGYYWAKGGTHARVYQQDGSYTLAYDADWMPIYLGDIVKESTNSRYNVVAIITPKASVEYYSANVHECDVAHDLEISTSQVFSLYVNSNSPITPNYNIVATDTVTRVGGQGRETKFWYDVESKWFDDKINVCTMVDTYLATVTRVTERVLDPAGHVITPAYLYLDVYDGQAVGESNKLDSYRPTAANDPVERNTSNHIAENRKANWEYAKGDKVLIKGWTDWTQKYDGYDNADYDNAGATNDTGLNHVYSQAEREQAAFETNILGANDAKISVIQKANPVLGKQTVTYWNAAKHTVDSKDYDDSITLFLDVAGTTTNTTFAWYFDTRGNLIGIDYVPDTVNYGIITSIWSSFTQGESSTTGEATTFAKVLYADGKEETISIDRFLVTNTTLGTAGHLAPTTAGTLNTALAVGVGGNTAELVPTYDYNIGNVKTMAGTTRGGTAKDATIAGYLHVAPVASINEAEDKNSGEYYGVIYDNLFKFEATADGKMTVIEVAGNGTNAGKFVGHYNTVNDDNSTSAKTGKLYKNLGYISVDGGSSTIAWLDGNTRIMLNDGDDKVTCYTLSTLPGDITIAKDSEIDWTETTGDGRVDVVYLTGTIEGNTTYNLFYYNGGAAQWNGVDKKGTMAGWLNGTATTITFDDLDEFNAVKNSQAYAAHLFALQMRNDVVSNVMGVNQTGANDPDIYLLIPTPGTAIAIGTADVVNTTKANFVYDTVASGQTGFKTGITGGNPYTANTNAVYLEDVVDTAAIVGNQHHVSYNAERRTIYDGSTNTYYLTPNSKVIGLGMSVTQETAILDYLNKTHNDVTIVYEVTGTQRSIVEIYVATDPDVTSSGEGPTLNLKPAGVTPLTLSATTTTSAAETLIKNMGPNQAVTCNVKTDASGAANADDVIYFPFSTTTATNNQVTLTIYRNGVPILMESTNVATAGNHFFVENFVDTTMLHADVTLMGSFTSGVYTFTITSSADGTRSSGSFTLNLQ